MPALWNFVTDFGDSAITVPLALLALAFLGAAGQRRLALGWVLAIGGCAVAIGVLKLVFGACGGQLGLAHITSPSGHTAMSTAVYGALALLVGAPLPPGRRRVLYASAAAAIVAIAVSRVALHDHTRAEIALGFAVGAVAVAVFRAALQRHQAPALPLKWLLLCGAALVALLHGTRWMVEPAVHRLAWDFRLALPFCR
ncbi:MAG TPA: phosphatase PAP2 family protein [Stellaceae bacterium]|nr:phosphatase PAP2 family protein [Stellaceae bacterium]